MSGSTEDNIIANIPDLDDDADDTQDDASDTSNTDQDSGEEEESTTSDAVDAASSTGGGTDAPVSRMEKTRGGVAGRAGVACADELPGFSG